MEDIEEEIPIKKETKEVFMDLSSLPHSESGEEVKYSEVLIKKDDMKFNEAKNILMEENFLLKDNSETKLPMLTSLVKDCSVRVCKSEVSLYINKFEKEKTDLETDEEVMLQDYEDSQQNETENDEVLDGKSETSEANCVFNETIECVVNVDELGEPLTGSMDNFSSDDDDNSKSYAETFKCRKSLTKSKKNANVKDKGPKYHCEVCGMEFKYKANCKKHEKLHDVLYRYKCKYCDLSFKHSLTLKKHYRHEHRSEKTYECEDCGSSFKSLNNLKSHIEVHHNTTGETFSCDFCHMEFKRRYYLKRHISIHTNPDKKFTCDDCGLKCRSKNDIAKHVLTHIGVVEKCFFCEICSAGFSKHAHLIRHKRTHSVEKPFPCELCDKAYKDKYSLKMHHETVHLGITFSCEMCGFQSDRHSLKKHLKRCANQKEYKCVTCHKVYYLKKWFEQHVTKCNSINCDSVNSNL